MPIERCRLCGKVAELQLSHVIPAFVFRWLRDTSGNGHIRTAMTPNLRVQDGQKRYWLCASCEERLNRPESTFASRIFHPYSSGTEVRFRYGPWLMQFGISVCWRILRLYREESWLNYFPADLVPGLDSAEETWKALLLGVKPHPGPYQLHVLPFDTIEGGTVEGVPPNINRYLMRAIDMDVVHGAGTAFVYAKLGRFVFLAFTRLNHPKHWVGTKVHSTEGTLEPRRYTLPQQLWGYLTHKARQSAKVGDAVSERQRERINESMAANIDKLAASDQMRALQQDVRLFGEVAVFPADEGKA